MCELNEFNQSNNYLIISPILELNNSSSPWDPNYPFDDDLSLNHAFQNSSAFLFDHFQSQKNLEILENGKKEVDKIKEDDKTKEDKIDFFNKPNIKEEENGDFPDFNIIKELSEQQIPKPLPQEKKEKSESNEIWNKSTKDSNNKTINKINISKQIFGIKGNKKIEQRTDYAIKNIKVCISKYLRNYGNELIQKCNFPNKLKKLKLFLPSYDYFTGNSNEKNNKIFLNFTVEQILTYPDEKAKNLKKDNRLQRQNKEIIQQLRDYIEEKYQNEIPRICQELLNFFKMSYEDIIISFYKSKNFEDYSSSEKTRQLDEQVLKVKGISLMENNGLIKLIKYSNKKNF